jgi:hypothetical protein
VRELLGPPLALLKSQAPGGPRAIRKGCTLEVPLQGHMRLAVFESSKWVSYAELRNESVGVVDPPGGLAYHT